MLLLFLSTRLHITHGTRRTPHTAHHTLCSTHGTPQTLHSTHHTLRSTHAAHNRYYTLHTTPHTAHITHHTQHTTDTMQHTWHITHYTSHTAHTTLHCTAHTPQYLLWTCNREMSRADCTVTLQGCPGVKRAALDSCGSMRRRGSPPHLRHSICDT